MSTPALYVELDELKDKMQTLINQSQIASLESCKAKMQECLDYLEGRPDCLSLFVDRAAHHAERAIAAIDEQLNEGDDNLYAELKRDDDRQRIADIKAEQRA